jgi:hypothetical protein
MKKFESPTVRLCDSRAPEPTISRREVLVDLERARKFQASIETLVISPMPKKPPSGLDGTTIEVTIAGSDFAGCRIWWWVTPPEEWKTLGLLADELVGWAGER